MPTPTIIPAIVSTEKYFAVLSVEGNNDDNVTTIKPIKEGSKIAHAAKQNLQKLLTTYEKDDDDEVTVVISNKTSNRLADNATNQTWPSSNASFLTTSKTATLIEPAMKISLPTKKQPTGKKRLTGI